MNGYGTIDKMYRPLGIGVIKGGGTTIIFTAGAVKRRDDGFQELNEGDEVNYRLFGDKIDGVSIARDIWKK